jgi:hypothetical protein
MMVREVGILEGFRNFIQSTAIIIIKDVGEKENPSFSASAACNAQKFGYTTLHFCAWRLQESAEKDQFQRI